MREVGGQKMPIIVHVQGKNLEEIEIWPQLVWKRNKKELNHELKLKLKLEFKLELKLVLKKKDPNKKGR